MATVRVNREDFLQVLESVQAGISPRELLEQSGCFVFKDKHVYTYNDEVACKAPTGFDPKFVGAIHSKSVLELLRKLPDGELDITPAKSEWLITGKRKESRIRCDEKILLPIDNVDKTAEWQPLHSDFADAIAIVQECAGTDQSRHTLTCIHITPKWVEACDNFQMARYRLKTGVTSKILVRRDSIKSIISLGMTEFCETESWIHFRNKRKLVLSCRRYLDEYDDLTPYLDVQGKPVSLPKGLEEAADRAEIFSADNVDTNAVLVEIRPEKLKITGQGVNGSHTEYKKIAKYDGKPLKFLISPVLLRELVKKHNEAEVTHNRLKIEGPRWRYVTVLGKVNDKADNENDGEETTEE
mgnify:CR=1 FL=1